MGDFNIDLNKKKRYTNEYRNILAANNLEDKIKGFTRVITAAQNTSKI